MTPDPQPTLPSSAVEDVVRRALRDMLVLLAVLLVLGVGIGWLVAGSKGVWGALIGTAIALLFSGTTVVSVLKTANDPPARTAAVIMGAWLAKIVVVFVLLAVLSRFDFYDRIVLAVVMLAGVVGSAVLDARAVSRGRVPYVEPRQDEGPAGPPSEGASGGPEHASS